MSSIASGSIVALNLAGSAAGVQRGGGDTDRIKSNAVNQKSSADQDSASARALGDVTEIDLSSDRDTDGRLPYGKLAHLPDAAEQTEDISVRASTGVPDAAGDRGNALDLQA